MSRALVLRLSVFVAVLAALCLLGSTLARYSAPQRDASEIAVGSPKTTVVAEFGKPDSEEWYSNEVLDPSKHSKSEVERRDRLLPTYAYCYGDIVVEFNAYDVVVSVRDRHPVKD